MSKPMATKSAKPRKTAKKKRRTVIAREGDGQELPKSGERVSHEEFATSNMAFIKMCLTDYVMSLEHTFREYDGMIFKAAGEKEIERSLRRAKRGCEKRVAAVRKFLSDAAYHFPTDEERKEQWKFIKNLPKSVDVWVRELRYGRNAEKKVVKKLAKIRHGKLVDA